MTRAPWHSNLLERDPRKRARRDWTPLVPAGCGIVIGAIVGALLWSIFSAAWTWL